MRNYIRYIHLCFTSFIYLQYRRIETGEKYQSKVFQNQLGTHDQEWVHWDLSNERRLVWSGFHELWGSCSTLEGIANLCTMCARHPSADVEGMHKTTQNNGPKRKNWWNSIYLFVLLGCVRVPSLPTHSKAFCIVCVCGIRLAAQRVTEIHECFGVELAELQNQKDSVVFYWMTGWGNSKQPDVTYSSWLGRCLGYCILSIKNQSTPHPEPLNI